MSAKGKDSDWTTVITPKNIIAFDLRELLNYIDLIILFVKRDLKTYYKQTVLGPFWYLIQPIASTIVFTVIFGNIAKIPTDGVPAPIFYMAGLLLWNYFSECFGKNSGIFLNNQGIFSKVYFPRLTVPIANILSSLLKFFIQFSLFIALYIYFFFKGADLQINLTVIAAPFILIVAALLSLGIGVIISSITIKYRDLSFLIGFGMQLWMYATPIVYPLSQIPEQWRWVYYFNPMAHLINTFRYGFTGSGIVDYKGLLISLGFTFFFMVVGILKFDKAEKTFVDTV